MNELNSRISEFLHKHHVLTLASCSDNKPWCANCFYIWLEEEASFVFTSDDSTKHIQDLKNGNSVAGSVVLETETIGKIRGIQFTGKLFKPEGDLAKRSKKAYLKRFPYALLMKTNIWVLEVDYIKMTDNRLGFGKKLIWNRQGETPE